jgi:hypothetical protein
VAVLLQAAPEAALAEDKHTNTPLHLAALHGHTAVIRQLAAAAPGAAGVHNIAGNTPLQVALIINHIGAARHLLLSPASEVLAALGRTRDRGAASSSRPGSQPAPDRAQWAQMPNPCLSPARALPTVLARSRAEARLLVQHLAVGQREQLRTFALCLARTQQTEGAPLPPDLTAHLLADAGQALVSLFTHACIPFSHLHLQTELAVFHV